MCDDKLLQILIADGKKECLCVSILVGNCVNFKGWPRVFLELGFRYIKIPGVHVMSILIYE